MTGTGADPRRTTRGGSPERVMIGAGAALRAKLDLAVPLLYSAAARLWQAPRPIQGYRRYLGAMHAVVRASVPLMETAARRCAAAAPRDPVAEPLRAYLRRHITEEWGHDVWVREDLEAISPEAGAAVDQMPPPSIAAMVGAQYYWILHHHPVCLLGYLAVLEGYPPPPGLAGHIAARTGYPDAALRTLRAHAVLDAGHAEEVYRLLDTLDLSPAQQAAVGLSALHTVRAAARVLTEVTEAAPDREAAAHSDGKAGR